MRIGQALDLAPDLAEARLALGRVLNGEIVAGQTRGGPWISQSSLDEARLRLLRAVMGLRDVPPTRGGSVVGEKTSQTPPDRLSTNPSSRPRRKRGSFRRRRHRSLPGDGRGAGCRWRIIG